MEFDINLVLVPITLVFLVAYLADKFWLKQHKHVVVQSRQAELAKSRLEDAKKQFEETLARFGHTEAADEFVAGEHTPQLLLDAHLIYQEAKRSYVHATGGIEPVTEPKIITWAYEYLPILAVIVLLRSFVLEPFNIPSSSMVPTLYTGDFIVVNKASYGLRLPITHTKILDTGSPKRGDVVVFRYPENPKRYYIKRMIGLPGDTIAFKEDVLSVNGTPVDTQKTDYQMPERLNAGLMPEVISGQKLSTSERTNYSKQEESHARYYQEQLDKHSYKVRYLGDLNSAAGAPFLQKNSPEVTNSQGKSWQITVPEGYLAGRATYIWMHKEPGFNLPSFGRAGKID